MTVKNETSQALQAETGSAYEALPVGSSVSKTDDWSSTESTDVQIKVKFNDTTAYMLKAENPKIGYPVFEYCLDQKPNWNACQDEEEWFNLDEGQSKEVALKDFDGKTSATMKVVRDGDDDDNKNWSVTLS